MNVGERIAIRVKAEQRRKNAHPMKPEWDHASMLERFAAVFSQFGLEEYPSCGWEALLQVVLDPVVLIR